VRTLPAKSTALTVSVKALPAAPVILAPDLVGCHVLPLPVSVTVVRSTPVPLSPLGSVGFHVATMLRVDPATMASFAVMLGRARSRKTNASA
jgi:hypothetical protein